MKLFLCDEVKACLLKCHTIMSTVSIIAFISCVWFYFARLNRIYQGRSPIKDLFFGETLLSPSALFLVTLRPHAPSSKLQLRGSFYQIITFNH